MRQKVFGIASITITSGIIFAIAACSAPSPDIVQDQKGTQADGGSSSKKDAGGSGNTTSGGPSNPQDPTPGGPTTDGGGPTAAGPCGDKTTLDDCQICCEDKQPKGADYFYGEVDKCLCQTPGACKTQCAATICNAQPKQPDQACLTCIQQNGSCFETASKACENDADCKLLLKCDDDSKCETKPEKK